MSKHNATIRDISQAPARIAAAAMTKQARAGGLGSQIPNAHVSPKKDKPKKPRKEKGAKPRQQKPSGPRKQPRVRLHPLLEALARSRARPFDVRGSQIPHTNNEAQSLTCFTTSTTAQQSISIPAGKCVQYCFFPLGQRGMGELTRDNIYCGPNVTVPHATPGPGDALAYHTRPVCFRDEAGNFNFCAIAPANVSMSINAAGVPTAHTLPGVACIRSGLTATFEMPVGSFETYLGSTVAGTTTTRWNPVQYQNQIPIYGSTEGHFRFVLVSCGVRWQRTTPGGVSGGYVTSVSTTQPVKDLFSYAQYNQSYFSRYPSYHVSAEDEGLFLPTMRPVDAAYNHPAMTDTEYATVPVSLLSESCNSVEACNAFLFVNNDTSSDQHYQLEFVWNWQISGEQVQTFSKQADLAPQLAPAMVQAANKLGAVTNAGPSHVMEAFSKAAHETSLGAVVAEAGRSVSSIIPAGFAAAVGLTG